MATDAKLRCNERYLAKLDRIVIRVHQDGTDGFTKGQIEDAAAADGQSVNAWLIDVIRDKFI